MKKIIPILAMTGILLNPFNLENIVANDFDIDYKYSVENPSINSDDLLSVLHKQADSRRDDYIQGGSYEGHIPVISNADFRKDSFTDEIMFYTVDHNENEIITEAIKYRGNDCDSYLDSLMARWLNLFHGQNTNINYSLPRELYRAYVDVPKAEAQNFAGVKNPLIISYAMRKIQEKTLNERMLNKYKDLNNLTDNKLVKIIDSIDNHNYSGSYQQIYETNPSNDLAKANVLMTIAVQEKTPEYKKGNREEIINQAMDYVNSAIDKFENKDSMFYRYLDYSYGNDSVQRFEDEFEESLGLIFSPLLTHDIWDKIKEIPKYRNTYLDNKELFIKYKL